MLIACCQQWKLKTREEKETIAKVTNRLNCVIHSHTSSRHEVDRQTGVDECFRLRVYTSIALSVSHCYLMQFKNVFFFHFHPKHFEA